MYLALNLLRTTDYTEKCLRSFFSPAITHADRMRIFSRQMLFQIPLQQSSPLPSLSASTKPWWALQASQIKKSSVGMFEKWWCLWGWGTGTNGRKLNRLVYFGLRVLPTKRNYQPYLQACHIYSGWVIRGEKKLRRHFYEFSELLMRLRYRHIWKEIELTHVFWATNTTYQE